MDVEFKMDNSTENRFGDSRPPFPLRPPPLFRSIGLSGLWASLPPHRWLCYSLNRSRTVLPANMHHTEPSDTCTFADLKVKNLGQTEEISLSCVDVFSEDAIKPEETSDLQKAAAFRSDVCSVVSKCSQTQVKQQDGKFSSRVSVSATADGKNTGRQARLLALFQLSEDPAVKEEQQRGKQKRYGAGRQKYVTPMPDVRENNAKHCAWLQSLGIVDGNARNSIFSHNLQQSSVARSSVTMIQGDPERATGTRRDRRPHFLPPINQVEPHLQVPLLLPENSPPFLLSWCPIPCSTCTAAVPIFIEEKVSRTKEKLLRHILFSHESTHLLTHTYAILDSLRVIRRHSKFRKDK